jgi:hypothetical protein
VIQILYPSESARDKSVGKNTTGIIRVSSSASSPMREEFTELIVIPDHSAVSVARGSFSLMEDLTPVADLLRQLPDPIARK